MSTRILILKDGVITPSRSTTDNNSIVNSLGLTKSSVGLNLVDNTSDVNKPISTATQTALNLKANLVSPNLTGTPTAPTATAGTNTTQIATTAFVTTAVSNVSTANFVDLTTTQTLTGLKTFNGGLVLSSTAGTSIGTLWRNGDALEYKDSANVTKILLNSAGNLSNLSNKQTALNNLVENQTANRVLRSNGVNVLLAQVGLTTDVTGVLPITNGGTGSATQNFVDLSSTQTIGGTKTFTSAARLQGQFPGFWLDEIDGGLKGAYIVLDGGMLQIQRRATNFGAFEATLTSINLLTGSVSLSANINSTSSTTGTLILSGSSGAGIGGNLYVDGLVNIGGQIQFPTVKNPSTNVNILDDYEEGTWTPTIIGTTIVGTGTYTSQTGGYTKIGRRVFFECFCEWSAHDGTGVLRLAGLPYTSAPVNNTPVNTSWNRNITLTANHIIIGYIIGSSTNITLQQAPLGGGAHINIPFDSSGGIMISGNYFTAT